VGRRGGTGVSDRYATEFYRLEEVPLRCYQKTKFTKKSTSTQEVARIIVEDMTTRMTLGLVLPENAMLGYKGARGDLMF
jgi:hypothetical protein